jgi:hypothetical protein
MADSRGSTGPTTPPAVILTPTVRVCRQPLGAHRQSQRDPVLAYRKAVSLARWIQRIPVTNDQDANDQRTVMAHTMMKTN